MADFFFIPDTKQASSFVCYQAYDSAALRLMKKERKKQMYGTFDIMVRLESHQERYNEAELQKNSNKFK